MECEWNIYSRAYGNEEETRGRIYETGIQAAGQGVTFERYRNVIVRHALASVGELASDSLGMAANGGRIYPDTNSGEFCTPECSTPQQATTYIKAGSEIYIDGLTAFAVAKAQSSNKPCTVVLTRRVIGDQGETWACHDNFAMEDRFYGHKLTFPSAEPKLLELFLRTRGFMCGAGLVTDQGLQYAQKFSVNVPLTAQRTYRPRMIRYVAESKRMEIACCDINLKDWATTVRLGGAGLVLAASQTPLYKKILDLPNYKSPDAHLFTNRLALDPRTLDVIPTPGLSAQVDLQYTTFKLILDELESASGQRMPRYLRRVAQSALRYCEDFDAVIHGTKDVSVLTNRSDWSQKVHAIRRDIHRKPVVTSPDGSKRIQRTPTDERARSFDDSYDRTYITATPAGTIERTDGYGVRIAARQSSIPDGWLEYAKKHPPKNTRAARRVERARLLGSRITSCTWATVSYRNGTSVHSESLAI